jgi:hypothetical protein
MPTNDIRIKRLYDTMARHYNMTEPFEEFADKFIGSEQARRKVYDAMARHYNMTESFEDFSKIVTDGSFSGSQTRLNSSNDKKYQKQKITQENASGYSQIGSNESWGRYWGWDPKETWALITMIVYSIVTHIHLVKKRDNLWLFNLLSVLAFASVLMTFFGVNYLLSGMHSYGVTDGVSTVFIYIVLAFAAISILALLSYRKRDTILK